MNTREASDYSHKELGWLVTLPGETIPYETAWVSADGPGQEAEEYGRLNLHVMPPSRLECRELCLHPKDARGNILQEDSFGAARPSTLAFQTLSLSPFSARRR